MKIQEHKSKTLVYEIEFPEPETSSHFFIGTGVGTHIPWKTFHVQSITERSKWLQFVQHLEGFATCSGKVLTAFVKYSSLSQRMRVMYVMWFCATGSVLKGVFFLAYTVQAHLFPYSLNLYSKIRKIMLLSLTQKPQMNPKPYVRLLLLLEQTYSFLNLNDY